MAVKNKKYKLFHKLKNKLSLQKLGFTLAELLVAIAVIGILATLSVVYVRSAYTKAKDTKAAYNAKQLQTALALYYADNGVFPEGSVSIGDGMCLTGNGFESCSGGTSFNSFINVAQAVDDDHGTASKVYLSNIPVSPYKDSQTLYVADQGGQWYTIFYKTSEAIKRAVPEDKKGSYPLASDEVRNWRIKTDLADIVNMMDSYFNKYNNYPIINQCFRDNKGCISSLVNTPENGNYLSEADCKAAKADNPNFDIFFDLSTISSRGFLGDVNYCVKSNGGNEFDMEYDLETMAGHDSSKNTVYKKHFKDHFVSGAVNKSGSIFASSFDKNELNVNGEYYKTYWTDFFKNGMKNTDQKDN